MRRPLLSFISGVGLVLACLLLPSSLAHAVAVDFNNGAVNTVDNTFNSADSIVIHDGPGSAPTTVNVLPGATIGATSSSSISVFDHSVLNVSGGDLLDELFLFNNSSGLVNGGRYRDDITTADHATVVINDAVNDDDLEAGGSSLMTVNGGDHDEDVESFGNATINIHGGMFQTGDDGGNIQAVENSVINVFGGTFGISTDPSEEGAVIAGGFDDSTTPETPLAGTVNLFGGNFVGQPEGLQAVALGRLNIFGGTFASPQLTLAEDNAIISVHNGAIPTLSANGNGAYNIFDLADMTRINVGDGATVNIYGTSFMINNQPAPFGVVSSNLFGFQLSDNGSANKIIARTSPNNMSTVNLFQVPEPEAIALGVMALGALCGVMSRRN